MLRDKWTTQEKEKVKTLYNKGLDDTQIAVQMGRSEKAISIMRGRLDCVKFHIDRPKGKKVGPRKKPRPGQMPAGAQLVMEEILPVESTVYSKFRKRREIFTVTDTEKKRLMANVRGAVENLLAGNEEIYPGPAIQKTILSDVGISGTINIYNHDGETDFTITNLAPRNAIHILARIISKLVIE